MQIDIRKATTEQLLAVAPEIMERALVRERSTAAARQAAVTELRVDHRVFALDTKDADVGVYLRCYRPLHEELAAQLGSVARRRGLIDRGGHYEISLEGALSSLDVLKQYVERAMKLTGFTTQGRSLFPDLKMDDTPRFYCQRVINRWNVEFRVVYPVGTARSPKLCIA